MKPRKKYNPQKHRINPNAHLTVINGIKAINSMQFGISLSTGDFTTLADMVNISLLLTEKNIGREYINEMYAAREAMQEAKQRYIKTNKLGFKADELKAVKVALTIHQDQIAICTLKEFSDAFDEQEKRIKAGNFYKRDGDLKVAA